jgi:hypothetical protein
MSSFETALRVNSKSHLHSLTKGHREPSRSDRAASRACREHTLRERTTVAALSVLLAGIGACSAPDASSSIVAEDESPQTSVGETAAARVKDDPSPEPDTTAATGTSTDPLPVDASSPTVDAAAPDAGSAATAVTADAILAKLATCTNKLSSAPYAKDVGGTSNIDVCGLTNAVFFKADMDIDCDGKSSAVCNSSTDSSYQNQTAATDSKGGALDAAVLPFIVVPGVSSRWSYKTSGIAMGTVGAVIYNGKIEYGIVGDVGPTSILGEASYAMAKSLGINPNPSTGGVSTGVTYVIFPNSSVSKKEDHALAVAVGKQRAAQLLAEN